MISRRLSAVAAALLLFASACTKGGAPAPGSPGGNAWTQHGVLRVGYVDEPDSLNPLFAHTDTTDQIAGFIYSAFMRYDDNGNFIPDLATEVPTYANGGISKDGKTLTFHLRRNAKWSDGQPLTMKDWLFTYRAVMNPNNNTKTRYGWDEIASATAPDPYTLIVRLKKVDGSILGMFAGAGGAAYPPLPEHLLGKLPDINKAAFNEHPLSSGPFVLQEWNHGSSLVFVPNQYYFRGKPKLHKIVWKVIPNVNTLFEQLQTHEIDVYVSIDENHIPMLSNVRGITVVKKLIANWRHMGINTSRPQLHDPRVRLALVELVDWKRMNDTVYHGYNQLAVSDVYPNLWAAPSIPPYPYDPEGAKKLLAQAGWTMGPDNVLHNGPLAMHITISTNTEKQENQQAEVQLQQALRPYGFDLQIRNYPTSLLFSQQGPLYQGHYDLEWSVETNGPDPDNRGLWGGKFIPPNGGNTTWLNDPVVDKYADLAVSTFDQTKRKAYYQKEEERLHELVPSQFFYWQTEYTAINSDLKNFKSAAFIQDTWNSWEWDI
ncbi:MAG TPA: peptide ABC transporter substrate-binding protein [Candidatus Baltobacteraceae bacterium]|nr:peptide ABC transporter substrate-binding protein [Candidatus Baltobacteraceae bacterium]